MLPIYFYLLHHPFGPLSPLGPTEYNIYGNSGIGDPVDLTTAIDTVSVPTYTTAVLAAPSDNTFLIRAFDSGSGYEEANTDCIVRIVIDSLGNDITSLPNSIGNLTARATANGGCRVDWTYNPAGQGGEPSGFRIWLTAGSSVNYAASEEDTVAYVRGRYLFSVDLTGLTDGAAYAIGVRAYNSTGDETNTLVSLVMGDGTGPDQVDELTIEAA